jgi:hypothetical protein
MAAAPTIVKTKTKGAREQLTLRYQTADAVVRLLVRCLLCALLFPVGCFAMGLR